MGASWPPSSSSGGGGEGKISSSRGAGGNSSSIGGGGGGKTPPRVPSASSPSPRRGGGGKGKSGVRRQGSQLGPLYPSQSSPPFTALTPNPRTLLGVSGRAGREGGARHPGNTEPGRPGARRRSGAAPVTLWKTDPEGNTHAPHSRLPPPGEGLGPVPGALAPSHELHDEVRTSARDRVAAPSPLRCNIS